MNKLLVVSHSTFAQGLVEACRMVVGDSNEFHYVGLSNSAGIEGFRNDIKNKLQLFEDEEAIIVLADLKGGSPHTATVDLLNETGLLHKATVITGANLSLLLGLSFAQDFSDKDAIQHIINESRETLAIFEVDDTSDDDEEL